MWWYEMIIELCNDDILNAAVRVTDFIGYGIGYDKNCSDGESNGIWYGYPNGNGYGDGDGINNLK